MNIPLRLQGRTDLPSARAVARSGSGARDRRRQALADLVALTKPRITALVVATCAGGMAMAPGRLSPGRTLAALVGTALVVASANTLNMWWERDLDARMVRTADRPLPAGRMTPARALTFGLLLAIGSLPLLVAVNLVTTALGLLALGVYVAIYTPLKRRTAAALFVGAVPGAMPPLMGWTSVTGSITGAGAAHTTALPGVAELGGVGLFALLFFWQLPHFLAISLCRKEDYASAGIKVIPNGRGERGMKLEILSYALLLVGSSVGVLSPAGAPYLAAGCALGALLIGVCAYGFFARSVEAWARSLFGSSIVYLVGMFAVTILERARALR